MSADPCSKRPRKGTKSCTECRRRKVQCIRVPEASSICRRCEKRGTRCTEQIISTPNPIYAKKLSSRERISQLEHQVGQLVRLAQGKDVILTQQPSGTTEQSREEDGSETDLSDVDEPDGEQPTHLRSLFQNDWLSVDHDHHGRVLQDRKAKASAHILEQARSALVNLIPSRTDFQDICALSSRWLDLLHTLLPQPFTAVSREEFYKTYDEMILPEVPVIALASWLLMLAITGRQDTEELYTAANSKKNYASRLRFSRRVSEVVESKLICHDRLLSGNEGLAMGMHFVRLQLGFGSFRKAWVHLRRLIAIAELMGLPNACHLVALDSNRDSNIDAVLQQKSQLWESISGADRILSLSVCLPSGTRQYSMSVLSPLMIGGVVNPRAYLSRMSSIATRIQNMDDMTVIQKPQSEIFMVALGLDSDLRSLAAQTPAAWWSLEEDYIKGDHMVQFLHYSTMMRIHLLFTMKQQASEEYIYCRSSCIAACKQITNRYRFLRQQLPQGMFISRMLDLQAFAATVVLLLTSFKSSIAAESDSNEATAEMISIVDGIVQLMDRDSSSPSASSSYGPQSASAIRALYTLLQRDDESVSQSWKKNLTLKVPLLGSLHITRNDVTVPVTNQRVPESCQPLSKLSSHGPTELMASQDVFSEDKPPALANPLQQAQWWDPFSWSVDAYGGNPFQDPIMAESFDPLYGHYFYSDLDGI